MAKSINRQTGYQLQFVVWKDGGVQSEEITPAPALRKRTINAIKYVLNTEMQSFLGKHGLGLDDISSVSEKSFRNGYRLTVSCGDDSYSIGFLLNPVSVNSETLELPEYELAEL